MIPLETVQRRIGQVRPKLPWHGLTSTVGAVELVQGNQVATSAYDDIWLTFLAQQRQEQVTQMKQTNITQIALKILLQLGEQWVSKSEHHLEITQLWRTLEHYTTYLSQTGALQSQQVLELKTQLQQMIHHSDVQKHRHTHSQAHTVETGQTVYPVVTKVAFLTAVETALYHTQRRLERQIQAVERVTVDEKILPQMTQYREAIKTVALPKLVSHTTQSTTNQTVLNHKNKFLVALRQMDSQEVEHLYHTMVNSHQLRHIQPQFFREHSQQSPRIQVETFLKHCNQREYLQVVNWLKEAYTSVATEVFKEELVTKQQTLTQTEKATVTPEPAQQVLLQRERQLQRLSHNLITATKETRTALVAELTKLTETMHRDLEGKNQIETRNILEQDTVQTQSTKTIHVETAVKPPSTLHRDLEGKNQIETRNILEQDTVQTQSTKTIHVETAVKPPTTLHQYTEVHTTSPALETETIPPQVAEDVQTISQLVTQLTQTSNLSQVVSQLEQSTIYEQETIKHSLVHRLNTAMTLKPQANPSVYLQSMEEKEGKLLLQYLRQVGVVTKASASGKSLETLRTLFRQKSKSTKVVETLQSYVRENQQETLVEQVIHLLRTTETINREKSVKTVEKSIKTVEKSNEITEITEVIPVEKSNEITEITEAVPVVKTEERYGERAVLTLLTETLPTLTESSIVTKTPELTQILLTTMSPKIIRAGYAMERQGYPVEQILENRIKVAQPAQSPPPYQEKYLETRGKNRVFQVTAQGEIKIQLEGQELENSSAGATMGLSHPTRNAVKIPRDVWNTTTKCTVIKEDMKLLHTITNATNTIRWRQGKTVKQRHSKEVEQKQNTVTLEKSTAKTKDIPLETYGNPISMVKTMPPASQPPAHVGYAPIPMEAVSFKAVATERWGQTVGQSHQAKVAQALKQGQLATEMLYERGKVASSFPSLATGTAQKTQQKLGMPPPELAGEKMAWSQSQLTFSRPLTPKKAAEIAKITAKTTVEQVVQTQVADRISAVHQTVGGSQVKRMAQQDTKVNALERAVKQQGKQLEQMTQQQTAAKDMDDGDVQRLAKAVMREMDAQIRLERQRRGIL